MVLSLRRFPIEHVLLLWREALRPENGMQDETGTMGHEREKRDENYLRAGVWGSMLTDSCLCSLLGTAIANGVERETAVAS